MAASVSPMLADVSKDVTGRAIEYPEDQLRTILSPAHFVENPPLQRDMRVFAGGRVLKRLHRRSRGTQHDERSGPASTNDRHVAAVVARRLFLLVGAVVLLVDDDQAEVGERGEDRRARADAHAGLAAAHPPPLVVALAR